MAEFVGRTAELRALRGHLDASPVTLVLGRAGIGKTATVRAATRKQRVVEIGVRPGDDRRQVLVAIGRALAGEVVVPMSLGDVRALGDAVVRAVEHVAATIVIDDLHHLRANDARALVEQTYAIARRSRWVFLARTLPKALAHPRWKRLTVEVEDMDRRALGRLARNLAPRAKPRRIAALVEAAQGSPWLLRRCLATRASGPPPDAAEIAAALPKRAAPVLRLLAALHLPIDATTARALSGGALPRGPEVEVGADRVRAHDALRDALARSRLESDLPDRLDVAADETGDAAGSLEAARLHLERGDAVPAARILERTFDRIVDAGLAPRLHLLLLPTTDGALSELRLRAAIVLGAGPPLDEVLADPRPRGTRARVRHAEALLLAGRPDEARALLERGERTRDAEFLLVRALLALGALAAAEALVARLRRIPDPRATALMARIAAARGRLATAVALADELGASAASLPSALRAEIQHARLAAYSSAGMLKQMGAAAVSLFGAPAAGRSFLEEQGALAALSLVEIEGGNVAEGRRLLGMLGAHAARAPYLRFFRRMNEVRIHTIEGDLPAATAETDLVLAEARVAKNRDHERWGLVTRSMLRLLQASDVRAPLAGDETERGDDAQEGFLRAFRSMRGLRATGSLPESARRHAANSGDAIDARIYLLMAEATDAFFRDDWDDAEGSARRAIALGEDNGYVAHALEGRLLLFDVLFVAGRTVAARAIVGETAAIATRIGARRFVLEAELAEALFAERPPVRLLERTGASDAVAPAAARRARALLGLADGADRVDLRVVASTPWHDVVRSARAGGSASWGIDLDEHRIWFPGGRAKAFAARALHGPIARALVLAGGECTKEELAKAVWNVRDYHPLRDDKRIHVAIMRLRRAVEDEKRPRRIVSTPDGYAIGVDEPMRIVGRSDGFHPRR